MAKTYISLLSTFKQQVDKINSQRNLIGDLALLKTTADSDLVVSLNEISDSIGVGGLNTTAATLISAINELHDSIGEVALKTDVTGINCWCHGHYSIYRLSRYC